MSMGRLLAPPYATKGDAYYYWGVTLSVSYAETEDADTISFDLGLRLIRRLP